MMYGVTQEILLEGRNIMLVSLMIIASSPGYICLSLSQKYIQSSKSFRNLLRDILTGKFLQSKVTGEESMRNSMLSFVT